nr:hypothetical protein HUO10_004343 [Paraburkholderia busanensis]
MIEALRPYYEQELARLDEMLAKFAQDYPRVAERLSLSGCHFADPHVERLSQIFALMAAGIRLKLDDSSPQFTEALIETLHPHYLRSFPSCSIARFEAIGEPPLQPVTVARATELAAEGGEVIFSTSHDVTIAAIEISRVVFLPVAAAAISAGLPAGTTNILSIAFGSSTMNAPFDAVWPGRVRLHLAGDTKTARTLLDVVQLNATQAFIEINDDGRWTPLPRVPVTAVGFEDNDALLPASANSSFIQSLLEYAAFPEKFDFVDVDFGEPLPPGSDCVTLHLALSGLHPDSRAACALKGIGVGNVELFCTPVVNLFRQRDLHVRRADGSAEYPVIAKPEQPAAFQVYSIDATRDARNARPVDPFASLMHGQIQPGAPDCYWRLMRDLYVERHRPGMETSLVLVGRNGARLESDDVPQTLSVDATFSNRDRAIALLRKSSSGDLCEEQSTLGNRVRLLRAPTSSFRPRATSDALWRVIALSTPNAAQLCDNGLREFKLLLRQCQPHEAVPLKHVDSVSFVRYQARRMMVPGKPSPAFMAGIEITLSLEEQAFAGQSVATFIHVMDRYFARYASANSFTQLVVLSKENGRQIRKCPPRRGRGFRV